MLKLGYIVLLSENTAIRAFCTMISARVAESQDPYSAETYAFADAFDFAYCARPTSKAAWSLYISFHIHDSKSFFDATKKCSETKPQGLMIEFYAIHHAYAVDYINNVRFIRSPDNTAHSLPKTATFHALYHLLLTGTYNFSV